MNINNFLKLDKKNFDEKDLEQFIFLISLENAVNYNGKANPKALIGKCISKFPETKGNISFLTEKINQIVKEVNKLKLEIIKKKLLELKPNINEKKENTSKNKRDGLPELKNTENGVVVRFEPAPSGYLHIGHLFSLVANYAVKKKYGGKFILRIADTNPSNIDIENYDRVIEDVKWITNNEIDEIVYQSDRMNIYYKYLRTLMELGKAYVCKCDTETFKNYVDNKEMCSCNREMSLDIQLRKFEKFMTGRYKQGEAVIRFRADYKHNNPAMRTFTLARINEEKHARVGKKYRVWPTMHLSVAIDDILMGITHVIRGKDHEINMERQKLIHKALNFKSPEYFHLGRMKFENVILSKSELSKMIKDGKYEGWDDPRVPSLISYRKRGFKAEAFVKYILSLGISKRDSKIRIEEFQKGLNFYNKQILEKEANRYFFVHNPKKITILNLNEYKNTVCSLENKKISDCNYIELKKHPEDKTKGIRKIKISTQYLIDSIDFNNLKKGDLFRMMHFANFKIISKNKDEMKVEYVSKEYSKEIKIERNIHYVEISNNENIEIILQNNQKLKGISEYLDNIKEGESIQFERFGFVRYDKTEKGIKKFYFTQR